MASPQDRNGNDKPTFYDRGERYFLTLGKVSAEEAEARSSQVGHLLRIELKLVRFPAGVAIEGKSGVGPLRQKALTRAPPSTTSEAPVM